MKRNIEINRLSGTREPRPGELSYELRRIFLKHCVKKGVKGSIKSVELAVARLASRFGFDEYECEYDRTASTKHDRPWITECVQVIIFRRRSNGTLSLYRAGATSYPRFFPKNDPKFANLRAPRDISIFYSVDEPYTWQKYYVNPSKMPARVKAKQKRLEKAWRKRRQHADA